ncbi:IS3 family transposase [Xenorhabdus cabanillasii]|uniref:HTH-like domain-containing protein n=1 Tax=Xenorhabdus cabanillasii JM26 TaxID=1427517 RepID=W1IRI3_9GAMM|nr:hypothetical protein XCR1_1510006 [Xenorhabdus cabanillasii JM26]
MQLRVRVRELYNQSRGAIGSRTLSQLLTNEGQPVGRWKARRLMQECGLQSHQPGAYSYHPAGKEHVARRGRKTVCVLWRAVASDGRRPQRKAGVYSGANQST